MAVDSTSRRFSQTEKSWITYDWANSVYATIIMAAVFPIYFSEVAQSAGIMGDVFWGYATSAATLTMAVLAPFLGAIGDFKGMKKRLLIAFTAIGLVFTTLMALTDNWQMMLVGYGISYVGFAGSLLFYDAFLTDVTTPDRMDKVSAWGYAMGYLGGSTIPFLISIALIMFGGSIGVDATLAVKLSCLLAVVWWALFSIPMLLNVRQTHYVDRPAGDLVKKSLHNLKRTLRDIIGNRAIFVFMLAYFFYIDGVNTVIHMATVYGSSLGLGSTGMILALLVTQLVAVPFSILFSKLSAKLGSIRMISSAIVVYFVICAVGFYMGFSLEPAEAAYAEGFEARTLQAVEAIEPQNLDPNSQVVLDGAIADFLDDARASLAGDERTQVVIGLLDETRAAAVASVSDPDQQAALGGLFEEISVPVRSYLASDSLYADFGAALARSSMLFWAMAVLVGTCQGGIQALSRSFFGKLIPPKRSNEFFGFFDIFGKFAAVIGPALYALTAHLTGHSSYGILSLMLLFAIGFATILIGRKTLREAERQALEAELNGRI